MHKLIEYYVTNTTINIFVLGNDIPNNPYCFQIQRSYSSLYNLIKHFRNNIVLQKNVDVIVEELYEVLIRPLVDNSILTPGENIYISPHRCLHYIPFQLLGYKNKPLILTNHIAYLPAGSFLTYFSHKKHKGNRCLVIKKSAKDDSLKLKQSFAREAKNVSSLLQADLIQGSEANFDNIAKQSGDKRIIHFTCHGSFHSQDAESSGLLISDEKGNDINLKISEISQIPFKADLITLAACETGINEEHPGDELIGLMRSFFLSGAKSVIASLWSVHSLSTEIFFENFYNYLLSGKSKIESLNLAQIDLMNLTAKDVKNRLEREIKCRENHDIEDDYLRNWMSNILSFIRSKRNNNHVFQHPYFWSPFILTGGWN